jgi:hypothetical protein
MPDNIDVQDYEAETVLLEEDEGDLVGFDELQSALAADITDAVNFLEEELSPDRERAINYYEREPFGDEVEGRSQYISADVHDSSSCPPTPRRSRWRSR